MIAGRRKNQRLKERPNIQFGNHDSRFRPNRDRGETRSFDMREPARLTKTDADERGFENGACAVTRSRLTAASTIE